MSRILKTALWLALFFGLLWLVIIIWWQTTHRIPTATDIALYMLGLPVALLVGYWVLKNSLSAIKLAATSSTATVQDNTADTVSSSVSELSGKERGYSLQLIASSVVLPIGSNAGEALASIQDGKRPELDKELTDADGFPVFAGRVPDVDIGQFLEEFDPPPSIPEHPQDQWPETVTRSLLMLRQIVKELSSKASEHSEAQSMAATGNAANHKQRNDASPFTLRISLILPEAWPLEILTWAATWFKTHLEVEKIWTAGPIIVNQISTNSPIAALTIIDQLSLSINRDDLRDLCIVATCDSCISQEISDAWSRDNLLFSSKQQNGLVPGEGAAGVLLASKKSAAGIETEKPTEIRRLAMARRDKSVDAIGKISSTLIEQLVDHALVVGNLERSKIAAVISDIDHRVNRVMELTTVTQKFTAIEPSTDNIALNAAAGHMGIASGLIGLALSHQLAQDKDEAVLFVSVSDAYERAALTLMQTPAASPTSIANATSPAATA